MLSKFFKKIRHTKLKPAVVKAAVISVYNPNTKTVKKYKTRKAFERHLRLVRAKNDKYDYYKPAKVAFPAAAALTNKQNK